jgi:tRNA1(Val) A37 N6-methylase TrmN6
MKDRKRLGAYNTSPRLAQIICRLALEECKRGTINVLDPAVGDGVFLTALASEWKKRRRPVSRLCLTGVDIRQNALHRTARELKRLGIKAKLLRADFLKPGTSGKLHSPAPGGFNLVIGNPPYGVKTDAGRKFGFNRDSYAAFIGHAAGLINEGGTLAFLVPDTWETIPSHCALREFLNSRFSVRLVANIRSSHFRAAVNPCILIAVKGRPEQNRVTAVDLTRTDADSPEFDWAVYSYPQKDKPRFFIGRPSLGGFFEHGSGGEIRRNGKQVRIVKVGEIAEVRHGLTTGSNPEFIRKSPGAYGGYRIVEPGFIVRPSEAAKLNRDELENGFRPGKFGKRYLLPYDKGERSDSSRGWLPNYFVPTRYFIDWRRSSVARMKKLVGHRHDNPHYYGRKGITFSFAGIYCPTFRLNHPGPFDHASCCIFPRGVSLPLLLGYLCSTPMRYLMRVFINHTVNFGVDAVKKTFIALDKKRNQKIRQLVEQIIGKQKRDLSYPYMKHEQPRIDRLVADALALSSSERKEIRTWFARRYPKLGIPPLF